MKISRKLILASASPRRKQLLKLLGVDFSVKPANINEDIEFSVPNEYCMQLAAGKASSVALSTKSDAIVLGADTIVFYNGEILNKPQTILEAKQMLRKLSGQTHQVYTGVALVHTSSGIKRTFFVKTDVEFRTLGDDEISAYVAGGSPMDKAGAYGIQDDFGAVFVRNITGCYYNIVGLPLEALFSNLKDFSNELPKKR